jgi:hypothetical protein
MMYRLSRYVHGTVMTTITIGAFCSGRDSGIFDLKTSLLRLVTPGASVLVQFAALRSLAES